MKKHFSPILFLVGVLMFAPAYAITLLSPNGAELWRVGTSQKIIWSTPITSNVKLEYQTSSGGVWNLIVTDIPAQNQIYDWLIPAVESSACRVRVTNLANETDFGESAAVFTITQVVPTAEAEPNNTAYAGNWMEYGDSLYAAITPLGDVDYYRFWGAEGDTIEIWGHHRNNSELGGRIFLYKADGTALTTNSGYVDPPLDQRIVWILPLDGVYYVRYAQTDNWGAFPNQELVERLEQENWEKMGKDLAAIQWEPTGEYTVGVRRLMSGGPVIIWAEGMDFYWNSARFRGYVNTGGLNTTVRFDYGLMSNFDQFVVPAGGPFNSVNPIWIESPIVNGLQSDQYYSMRMEATNALGTSISSPYQFVTLPPPEGWERKISGFDNTFNDVFFINDNVGIIVGDSIIIRTADGGDTWTSAYAGTEWINFKGVFFASSTIGFAIGSYGNVLKTADAGLTWAPISTGTGQYLFAGYFVNNLMGWIIGDNGTIIHTADGGSNWTQQNSGTGNALRGVYFIDENVGIAVGDGNTILRTTNGGTAWTPITAEYIGFLSAVHFADPLVGVIVGESNSILRTADGGLAWQTINISTESSLTFSDVHFYQEGYGIAVGRMGAIYRTSDGGLTWNFQQSGTMNNLYALHNAGSHSTLIGRHNAILRSVDFLSLKAPNGGEVWAPGTVQNIVWWTDMSGEVKLEYCTSSGSGWTTIVASTPTSAGSYAWTIPAVASDNCKVRISTLPGEAFVDESDNVFSIKAATVQQKIKLLAGWNMISSYIDPPDSTLPTLLGPLGTHLVIAKNNVGQVYYPLYGINTIGKWKPFQGYKCYMTAPDSLIFEGEQLIPESTPIALASGWNTAAYLRTGAMSADAALTSIIGSLVIAKNMAGGVYYPLYHINTIGNMLPGQGYQIYLSAAATLTYPANTSGLPKGTLASSQAQPLRHFKISHRETGNNAILLLRTLFLKDGDEVAVYASGEQFLGAGSAQGGQALVTIWGDDDLTKSIDGAQNGDKLALTWWSASTKTEAPLQIATLHNGLNGSALPADLCYQNDAMWVAEVADDVLLPKDFALRQNYPNPFNPVTSIGFELPKECKVHLVVYNMRGQVIRILADGEKKAGYHDVIWDGRNHEGELVSSGIYLVRMESGSYAKTIKISLIK